MIGQFIAGAYALAFFGGALYGAGYEFRQHCLERRAERREAYREARERLRAKEEVRDAWVYASGGYVRRITNVPIDCTRIDARRRNRPGVLGDIEFNFPARAASQPSVSALTPLEMSKMAETLRDIEALDTLPEDFS